MPPSVQFYADLHCILKRKRIPIKEIGMVYRAIDPEICQSTASDKEAYIKVQDLVSNFDEPSDPKDDSQSHSGKEVSSCDESTHQGRFAVPNVKRREKRAKTKIKGLQKSLKYFKRVNKVQREKIENLSAALESTRSLVHDRNVQITDLSRTV